ncbi:MAG: hypothetical protein A2Z99_02855 [Treponema sp. GWB1_62_6]|nr:MAG: hypothetical protein A2001_08805 [Treponema sp. GWC1_61_84]OHE70767.1 MAG: hypothetical protein A2413_10790 [Treponema sp. RIFOXYC1_FULL_61_9]OHE71330.1 MAG: hypothetical protein A2Z99_02855 [Treponema sp. GWB1_62_6]HCM25014.1 hypothetical protein [Treponema sp.]
MPESGYDWSMNPAADLFTLLRLYANRNRTPSFTVDSFIGFLEKYAARFAPERPELSHWVKDTSRKVWDLLPALSESGRTPIVSDVQGTTVSIPQYFSDLVLRAYKTADETPELPFPDEVSLRLVIPPAQLRSLNLEADFSAFLAESGNDTVPIVKIIFPESGGSMIIPSSMIPKKLLELSLIKIRHYLRTHNNKDYVQHKLAPAFIGKETMLKDTLNQLMVRPFDSLNDLEKAGDFAFPFWAYFSSLVKGDIRKKNDKLPEDTAALQSVYVIEVFNNYYKGKVQKERESETALKNLDLQLEKPPYFYSMDDVVRFVDSKGIPLLGQYSRETLEETIKKKTTSGDVMSLPELLIIHGLGGERWFVDKSRMLPLCVKLLGEARPRVKTSLTQRWFKLKSEYISEPSMEDDDAFDAELAELTETISPVLAALIGEKTLFLVHDELGGTPEGIPEAGRLFHKENLAPLSELYLLSRKDVLTDVRMLLPFWHTVPIFSAFLAFLSRLGEKQGKTKKGKGAARKPQARAVVMGRSDEGGTGEAPGQKGAAAQARKTELKKAAKKLEATLVPEGYTIDGYLADLQNRWNRIITPQAKANLTEDVNSLIRDYLRKTARTIKAASFTRDRIADLADSLAETPALLKLPSRDSLRLYIQVYMVKLVLKS